MKLKLELKLLPEGSTRWYSGTPQSSKLSEYEIGLGADDVHGKQKVKEKPAVQISILGVWLLI